MASLQILTGPDKGVSFEIQGDCALIGRLASSLIRLVDDKDVSREHAEVRRRPDGSFMLTDRSKNGTRVNGVEITEQVLSDADEIQVGDTRIAFRNPAPGRRLPLPPGGVPFAQPPSMASPGQTILSIHDSSFLMPPAAGQEVDAQAMERVRRHLGVLTEVSETIVRVLDLDQVLDRIMDLVFRLIKPDHGFILLVDAGGDLAPRVHRDCQGPVPLNEIKKSQTIIDLATGQHVAVLAPDIASDDRLANARSVIEHHFKSAMCVPLVTRDRDTESDRLLGVLQVHNRITSGDFDREALEFLTVICNLASVAIENAILFEERQRANRTREMLSRYFSPQVVEELVRAGGIGEAARKEEATVLFSDIRGFTALAEDMDPADVVALLNDYFSKMVDVIFHHGGNIDKFIGDAILAYFGGLRSEPDHAVRAVRCALEMQACLDDLCARWQAEGRPAFRMGIGINTGRLMLGNIGSDQRREFTVIGDVVNTASRINALAGPGETIVTRATADLLGDAFRLRARKPVMVKGRSQPVELREVLRQA